MTEMQVMDHKLLIFVVSIPDHSFTIQLQIYSMPGPLMLIL